MTQGHIGRIKSFDGMVSNSFGALKADAVTHVSELIVSGVLPPQNAFEIGVNHNCAESRSSAA